MSYIITIYSVRVKQNLSYTEEKTMKKILFIFFLLMISFPAQAKRGLNIFAYSRPAPETPIYDQYGKAVKLKDFKGSFLIVVFWSRYCAPCIGELDELNYFVNHTKDNGIKAILVSKDDEWQTDSEQKQLLIKYEAPDIEYYTDKKGKLTEDFGIFSSPHTVLINAQGEEIGRINGSVDWDDDDVIEKIYQIKAEQGLNIGK